MSKKQLIEAFFSNFTLETTPGAAKKISRYNDHIRAGTRIYITFLPGSDFNDTIDLAIRLRKEGFEPIPHLAARSIPDKAFLENAIKRCVEEAGTERFLVIGGGVDEPIGEYRCSAQILESGLLDKYHVKSVGLAGHPEGNPDISDENIEKALTFKNAFAERTDINCYLVTQFCFEAEPIIAWDKALRAAGNQLPIHIGIPGLASLKSLIAHSKACGVGASMRFLTKQAKSLSKLLMVNTPDKLCVDLVNYQATDPDCGIKGMHLYPLGGLKKTTRWAYAVRDGKFEMTDNESGFTVYDE